MSIDRRTRLDGPVAKRAADELIDEVHRAFWRTGDLAATLPLLDLAPLTFEVAGESWSLVARANRVEARAERLRELCEAAAVTVSPAAANGARL